MCGKWLPIGVGHLFPSSSDFHLDQLSLDFNVSVF